MNIIFINSLADTFTPTNSGAVSTWYWEMCRLAQKNSIEPLVISKTYGIKPYPWPKTILIPYPNVRPFRGAGRLFDIQRKISGWTHLRQKDYLAQVVRAIRSSGAEDLSLILNNNIDTAVFMRSSFPKAFILHNAQNNNICSERFRRQFRGAVNVATAVSNYVAACDERYFGFPSGKIQTLYNGVDCERFYPPVTPPAGPPVINFLGTTQWKKGTDLMIRACLQLTAKTKAFSVQILGANYWGEFLKGDKYVEELKALIEKLKCIGITVRWPGFVNRWDLPGELQKAHIHVIPSRCDEACALSLLEGMACGLATVASRTGGTPELVGDSGLLFERDSAEELAGHLYNLVTNENLRLEYGRRARKRAEEFTWSRTWVQLKKLLRI